MATNRFEDQCKAGMNLRNRKSWMYQLSSLCFAMQNLHENSKNLSCTINFLEFDGHRYAGCASGWSPAAVGCSVSWPCSTVSPVLEASSSWFVPSSWSAAPSSLDFVPVDSPAPSSFHSFIGAFCNAHMKIIYLQTINIASIFPQPRRMFEFQSSWPACQSQSYTRISRRFGWTVLFRRWGVRWRIRNMRC